MNKKREVNIIVRNFDSNRMLFRVCIGGKTMMILHAFKEWIDVLEMFIKIMMIAVNVVKAIQKMNSIVHRKKHKTNRGDKRKVL